MQIRCCCLQVLGIIKYQIEVCQLAQRLAFSQQRSAVPGATTINNQVDYWNVDSRQQYNVNTASSGSTNNVGGIHSNYNDNFLLSVSAPVNGMPQGHSNRSANSLPEEVAASIFSNSSMFANAGSFVEQ